MRGCWPSASFASRSLRVTVSTVTGFDDGVKAAALSAVRSPTPVQPASKAKTSDEDAARSSDHLLAEFVTCVGRNASFR